MTADGPPQIDAAPALIRCPRCRGDLPAEMFYQRKSGRRKGSRIPYCKPCQRQYGKDRRARP